MSRIIQELLGEQGVTDRHRQVGRQAGRQAGRQNCAFLCSLHILHYPSRAKYEMIAKMHLDRNDTSELYLSAFFSHSDDKALMIFSWRFHTLSWVKKTE